jgi:UMP-CMP kinase|tara:strand:+ start:5353 stop:5724 length:372 start_codon:yes stop_codon:yes gene_type:complete
MIVDLPAANQSLHSRTGFPRKLDQAEYFEQHVAPVTCVSVFDCPQDVLLQRLSSRGRADDTIETIKRRIATFDETTSQVLKKYEARDIVTRIRSDCAVEAVTERLQQALQDCGVVLKLRETIA